MYVLCTIKERKREGGERGGREGGRVVVVGGR